MQATDVRPAEHPKAARQKGCGSMLEKTDIRFEAWLDEENRIVSFHEIPGSRYYSTEDHAFWQRILRMVLAGYRVQ